MIKLRIEYGIDVILAVLRRCRRTLIELALFPGRHDLYLSGSVTGVLIAALLADPVAAQVGVSEAEQVLCSDGFNAAQVLTVGLGLVSMYLILKALLRMMVGLDNAGATELVGSDGVRRTDAAGPYGRRQARGGIYSLIAALLPVFVPVFLSVIGVDVASCLLP